jgi:hypothetical protein
MKKKLKKTDLCPICEEFMDLAIISCKKTPFVDGRNYSKMCFTCWHVPKEEVQIYDEKMKIKKIEGPFYDHIHLNSAQELVDEGSADCLKQARKSIRCVKKKCKGLKQPIKYKKPKQELG